MPNIKQKKPCLDKALKLGLTHKLTKLGTYGIFEMWNNLKKAS